jgi:hypothetical protein
VSHSRTGLKSGLRQLSWGLCSSICATGFCWGFLVCGCRVCRVGAEPPDSGSNGSRLLRWGNSSRVCAPGFRYGHSGLEGRVCPGEEPHSLPEWLMSAKIGSLLSVSTLYNTRTSCCMPRFSHVSRSNSTTKLCGEHCNQRNFRVTHAHAPYCQAELHPDSLADVRHLGQGDI